MERILLELHQRAYIFNGFNVVGKVKTQNLVLLLLWFLKEGPDLHLPKCKSGPSFFNCKVNEIVYFARWKRSHMLE